MEAHLLPVILTDSQERAGDASKDLPLRPKHLNFRTPRGRQARSHGPFHQEKAR